MSSIDSRPHAVSALFAVMAILLLPVVAGAVFAPHIYMGLLSFGRAFSAFDFFRTIEFISVLNRVVLVSGGLTGWWLYKRMQMHRMGDLGMVPFSAHQRGLMLLAWVTGIMMVFLWGVCAAKFGAQLAFSRAGSTWGAAVEAVLAGWIVACIEELYFRGLVAGIVHRIASVDTTALLVGLFFSLVHFAEPEPFLAVAHAKWDTGLSMIPHVFTVHDVLHGRICMMGSLFFLGCGLVYLRYAYDSIWVPIGMHAGWVPALKLLSFRVQSGVSGVSFWHTQGDVLRGWGLVLLALAFALSSRNLYQRKKRKQHVQCTA